MASDKLTEREAASLGLMQVEVDGVLEWREVEVSQRTLYGQRYTMRRPKTEPGEILVETLGGRPIIVKGKL